MLKEPSLVLIESNLVLMKSNFVLIKPNSVLTKSNLLCPYDVKLYICGIKFCASRIKCSTSGMKFTLFFRNLILYL